MMSVVFRKSGGPRASACSRADVEGCLAAQSWCDDRSKFVRRQQMTQPTTHAAFTGLAYAANTTSEVFGNGPCLHAFTPSYHHSSPFYFYHVLTGEIANDTEALSFTVRSGSCHTLD